MERCYQQLLILSQVHPHAVVFCFPHFLFFFHFYPSPTISPLSSSLFHSLSFLLSQCNVIQDRCWQPQLWHCNLCSALVARQPVWDRVQWCTSLSVCLQKKREREGEWQSWPSGHQPKFKWSLQNFSVFRMGCFTSAVQQSTFWAWGLQGSTDL